MGKASQTKFKFPDNENTYATGNNTINCLATDVIRLYKPLPRAWKIAPETTQKPANTKLKEMVLNAVIPMDNMCSEALNIPKSR